MVEFRSDAYQLVLGERGQIGVAVRYRRSSRVVFSLVPRCHGRCGSQKNTGSASAAAIAECCAISPPRTQATTPRPGGNRPRRSSPRQPPRRPRRPRGAPQPSRSGWRGQRGCDRRWARSEHENRLPMAGQLPGISLGRSLTDGDHVPDLAATCERFLPRGPQIARLLRRQWNMLASNTFRDGI